MGEPDIDQPASPADNAPGESPDAGPSPQASSTPPAEASPPSSPESSAADDTPTASPDKAPTAPEPPRWRFVNEAKKSLGYSSLHAGTYIKGQGADELGAKYTAPDVSLYKPAKEVAEVNRVSFSLPRSKSFEKEGNEVGKLSARSWHGTPAGSNSQVGRLGIQQVDSNAAEAPTGSFRGLPQRESQTSEPRAPFKTWDPHYALSPKKGREQEWHDGKVRDAYTMPKWRLPGRSFKGVGKIGFHGPGERDDSFVGEVPKGQGENVERTARTDAVEDGYDDPREGALFIQNDESNGGKDGSETALTEPVDDINEKKKKRCLYLLLLLLLAIVAILGALLGKRNGEGTAANAIGGVLLPPILAANETSVPSSFPSAVPTEVASVQPSASPSRECPLGTKAFSVRNDGTDGSGLTWPPMSGNFRWRITDACSGKAIVQCGPCSSDNVGSVELSRPEAVNQYGRNGPYRRLEDMQDVTRCLPEINEYMLEVVAVEDGAEGCCGFDPATSIIAYDDVPIDYGATNGGGIFDDASSAYFGEREVPCPTARPSLASSDSPSTVPSAVPSPFPTASPSTSPPTRSPVVFLGGCPEVFSSTMYYDLGAQVEVNGMVYQCVSSSCNAFGFEPGPENSSLWRQAWEVVASCSGTRPPTERPTTTPTADPTESPSRLPTMSPSEEPTPSPSEEPTPIPTPVPSEEPTPSPSEEPTPIPTPVPSPRQRTRRPTPFPTPRPTCDENRDFNLCLAVDMSGSVCNDGSGSECLGCRASFLPIFFMSECRDTFVDEDTCCRNFDNVKEFSTLMVSILGNFDGDKAFSVVQFATGAHLVSTLDSADQTIRSIGGLDYTGGLTNHAAAINLCQQTFPTFTTRKNFIMLVTDGVSSEPSLDPQAAAEAAAADAKRDGTAIIPVFISPSGNDWDALSFMRRLSNDGRVFDVTDFSSLNSLQEGLVDQVSCS